MIVASRTHTIQNSIERLHATHEYSNDIYHEWYTPGLDTRIMPRDEDYRDIVEGKPFAISIPKIPLDNSMPWSYYHFGSVTGFSGCNITEGTAEHFSFESDCGHGANEQTPEQIDQNDARLAKLGFIEGRKSRGRKGRHYRGRFTTPVPLMGDTPEEKRADNIRLCQFVANEQDMADKTCGLGSILYSQSQDAHPDSFELVFPATTTYDVPDNWRDTVPAKSTSEYTTVDLSPEHQRILDALDKEGWEVGSFDKNGTTYYRAHTAGLKQVPHRGSFDTISLGRNPGEPNCYMLPQTDGSFQVFRFSNTDEPTWQKRESDGKSWCWYNAPLYKEDWTKLTENHGGIQFEGRSKKTKVFSSHQPVEELVKEAGGELVFPQGLQGRQCLATLNSESILVQVVRHEADATPEGWTSSKKYFSKSIPVGSVKNVRDVNIPNVRVCYDYSEFGQQQCDTKHYIRHDDGTWKPESSGNTTTMLLVQGSTAEQIYKFLGEQYANPLKIVKRPFEQTQKPGYWNRGYGFSCEPSPGSHPHFDSVLRHTGEYLDPYVAADSWCQANGIKNGYDFLVVYCAIMAQHPEWRVPQLFLYSTETGTGKDSFAMSLSVLMDHGAVQDAKSAATNSSGFNSELEGTVIYRLDEIDLSKSGSVPESRCREWVTNPILNINKKFGQPYSVINYGRVIQTSNDLGYKVVDAEDSRVIVIQLSPIETQLHWQLELEPALKKEASAFLYTLLNYQLPKKGAPGSRCFLPILMTDAKQESITANLPPLRESDRLAFEQVVESPWDGILEFSEIPNLIRVGFTPAAWSYFWKRATPHFQALGHKPVYRPYAKHKNQAGWGFNK